MGWFRIDDRADDNPKLLALSDGALRLWLMGGIHCAKHKTDGLLTQAAAFGLRKFTKARLDELLTLGLWHQTDTGFQVHDFLDWNLSKAEIDAKQANGRARVQRHRAGSNPSVSNALRNAHTANGMV